jgi:pimeloyl-ACP methyl ester carboxylesterase
VLVPDLPGFGDSDLPEQVGIRTIVASIWSDLDQLIGPDGDLDLVGFSFGGGLGGEIAAAGEARVGRLVLVGSAGFPQAGNAREELVKWRDLAPTAQREAHRRNLQILMFGKPETVDELAISLQADNAGRAKRKSRLLRGATDLGKALTGRKIALSGIWGELDFTLRGIHLAERERSVKVLDPGAEWVVLPGIGHWVQYEAAKTFNTELLRILGTQRRWGGSDGLPGRL